MLKSSYSERKEALITFEEAPPPRPPGRLTTSRALRARRELPSLLRSFLWRRFSRLPDNCPAATFAWVERAPRASSPSPRPTNPAATHFSSLRTEALREDDGFAASVLREPPPDRLTTSTGRQTGGQRVLTIAHTSPWWGGASRPARLWTCLILNLIASAADGHASFAKRLAKPSSSFKSERACAPKRTRNTRAGPGRRINGRPAICR